MSQDPMKLKEDPMNVGEVNVGEDPMKPNAATNNVGEDLMNVDEDQVDVDDAMKDEPLSVDSMKEDLNEDLLIEIGSDEIPARYLLPAIREIKVRTAEALEKARLSFGRVDSYGTPRRLVVYVTALAPRSTDITTKVRGPSKKAAYDSQGNPTRALLGFSRSLGIDPSEVVIEGEAGGEYVYGVKHEPGRPVEEILPEILPQVVLGMDCPHPLRWGEGDWRWYRSIRWVVCLYGEKPISMGIAGVRSGRMSFGHRTLHPEKVEIHSASAYFQAMEGAGVVVDHRRRREIILSAAKALAREMAGRPLEDQGLLDEVTCLCEHPAPFRGEFSPDYLKLPKEVLITVMRHHQRYFPILGDGGNVLPGFIGVRDGSPTRGMDNVVKGNEWVLVARLEDALFFYSQDLGIPLADRLPELKGVYFLRGAGTLWDKTHRLMDITTYLGRSLGLTDEQMEPALEAARLAKCDLVTLLVRELPELEGVMGGHYARAQGAEEQVAKAISQHYMPKGAGDKLPDKGPGALVAMADKLDTLSVAFALGIQVSGSQDPLGLRRAASGVANIMMTHGYDLRLDDVLRFTAGLALSAVKQDGVEQGSRPSDQPGSRTGKRPGRPRKAGKPGKHLDEGFLVDSLKQFILQRVEALLIEQGLPIEMIRGVVGGAETRIARLPHMARALAALAGTENLDNVVTGWRRTSVLGSRAQGRQVAEDLLVEEPEKQLYRLVKGKGALMEALFENKQYQEYLQELSALRAPIDSCLDKVLIMAEDESLKQNRLRLLGLVSDMFTRFADFSHVLPLTGKA
ncbi:MAG: glycine--tRNA ligase subunit beta [Firmicutes bacterium]|nr:glycine--tRNA ligase subunit beta [Candidatus Fermentithermobacillaceae bacterium]